MVYYWNYIHFENIIVCIVLFLTECPIPFDGENGNQTITSQIFRKERLL